MLGQDKQDAIRSLLIQLANFIDGGSEQVASTADFPLMYFDDNEKAVIERTLAKIKEVVER